MIVEIQLLPCPECLDSPAAALHGDHVEACWCSHRQVGVSYANGRFAAFTPISLDEFRALVAAADVRAEAAAARADAAAN